MVELAGCHSKPAYEGPRIRKTVESVGRLAKTQSTQPVPTPQEHRVDRRLSTETIAELVQAYRHGVGTRELRRRHDLSQGSVIKILHDHAVEMRSQGLADEHVAIATAQYRGGASLAQIGERFVVSSNAVRRTVVAAGVVMRPRGGSKPK